MSVYRRFNGHGLATLVTSNVDGRRPLFQSSTAVRMLLEVLGEVRRDIGFELCAWVVMPDHIHLVIGVPDTSKLSRVMQLIKGRFANRYNRLSRWHGTTWQSRYHARVLRSERALNAAIEYVQANPVVAGLTLSPRGFAWSSARKVSGPVRLRA